MFNRNSSVHDHFARSTPHTVPNLDLYHRPQLQSPHTRWRRRRSATPPGLRCPCCPLRASGRHGLPTLPRRLGCFDSSGGGEVHQASAAAATGDGGSGAMSKKQRTEEPSSSSSGARECSSASVRAPQWLPDARGVEDLRRGSGSEGGAQARVPDLREDLVFELLMRAKAWTLASAACVSSGWRQLAREEWLRVIQAWQAHPTPTSPIHPTHLHLDR
ncbi:hypothetical protein U9M48_004932 [Paspalum notatum var. saurae]|uniref:F-box domain-containing protein n=1 Tax=Paspalum notatum var. saurae TaxID=547442 RepID=A0AAQ3PWA7_PASNO